MEVLRDEVTELGPRKEAWRGGGAIVGLFVSSRLLNRVGVGIYNVGKFLTLSLS
jgi:hypothetical protein